MQAAALLLIFYAVAVQVLAALPVAAAAESLSQSKPRQAALFWLAVSLFAPAVAGLLAAISLVMPAADVISPHLERVRPHLCWRFLTHAPDAPWHLHIASLLALGLIAFAIIRFLWRWISSRRVEERARRMLHADAGDSFITSEAEGNFSFTVGLSDGVVVISSDLVRMLSPEALRALLAHEQAHIARRDNLWHLLIELAATLALPSPLGFLYASRRRAAAEADCDARAAQATSCDTVTELLLMLAEHNQRHPGHPSGLAPVYQPGISPHDRAERLSSPPRPTLAPPLLPVLAVEAGIILAAAIIARHWLADTLYCAGETVLSVLRMH